MSREGRCVVLIVCGMLMIGCGAAVPAPTPLPLTIPTNTLTPLSPTATHPALPPATIAVAQVPTLPPIIVTNPLPAVTPWPTLPPITVEPNGGATATATSVKPSATPTLLPCPPLPTPTALETGAAAQHFEHGLMFWLQSRNEIWALVDSPTTDQFYWWVLPNLWYEGTPEADLTIKPPSGRYQPVRGFGAAWRATPNLREDLGWAVDQEAGFQTTLTYYPQGFYSPDCTWEPKSGIYEMKDNAGGLFRFVGEGGVAYVVIPP
jgi:hypothetical protein